MIRDEGATIGGVAHLIGITTVGLERHAFVFGESPSKTDLSFAIGARAGVRAVHAVETFGKFQAPEK